MNTITVRPIIVWSFKLVVALCVLLGVGTVPAFAQVADHFRDSQPASWMLITLGFDGFPWMILGAIVVGWVSWRAVRNSPHRTAALVGILTVITLLLASTVFAQGRPSIAPMNIVPDGTWQYFTVKDSPKCDPSTVLIDRGVQTASASRNGRDIVFSARAVRGAALGPVNVRINCADGFFFSAAPFAITTAGENFVLNRSLEAAATMKTVQNDLDRKINANRQLDQARIAELEKRVSAAEAAAKKAVVTKPQAAATTTATPQNKKLEAEVASLRAELVAMKTAMNETLTVRASTTNGEIAKLNYDLGVVAGLVNEHSGAINDLRAVSEEQAKDIGYVAGSAGDNTQMDLNLRKSGFLGIGSKPVIKPGTPEHTAATERLNRLREIAARYKK